MMIFWRRGLALLSIPKTGTHAYQAAYGDAADIIFRHPQPLKHMGLRRFRIRILPLLQPAPHAIETMALIREPLDWLGSWYRYRARPEIASRATSTAGLSFEDFVTAYLQEKPPAFANVGSQRGLLVDADGATVTHLFAFEAGPQISAFLTERLKVTPVELPQVNVSPKMPLPLSPETRERLMEKLAPEYALYETAKGRPTTS